MAKQLQKGDKLPEFEALDQHGETLKSAELTGDGPFIVYFYPKDDTPVCTAEACKFRDEHEAFAEQGAKVVGVSSDSVDAHRRFADKHGLKFRLLADTDEKLRDLFGVPRAVLGLIPGRVTYVFDSEGRLQDVFSYRFQGHKHVEDALAAVKRLAS